MQQSIFLILLTQYPDWFFKALTFRMVFHPILVCRSLGQVLLCLNIFSFCSLKLKIIPSSFHSLVAGFVIASFLILELGFEDEEFSACGPPRGQAFEVWLGGQVWHHLWNSSYQILYPACRACYATPHGHLFPHHRLSWSFQEYGCPDPCWELVLHPSFGKSGNLSWGS